MNNKAKQGSLIQVECGQYSDYQVIGFFVTLQDFTPGDEVSLFFEAHPEQKEVYGFNEDKFLAFLIAKGYLLEITRSILDLGSADSVRCFRG